MLLYTHTATTSPYTLSLHDALPILAEDQVEGGAHVLDVCVALTERQDEDEQMRQVVKRVSLTQPAPIQVDSTEPDVIRSEEHTSELQSSNLVCRLLLENKNSLSDYE